MNFGGGGRQRLVFSSNSKWGCMRVMNFRAHCGPGDLRITCSTLCEFGFLSRDVTTKKMWMRPSQRWAESALLGWNRVKISESLGATAVAPVTPVDTSLLSIYSALWKFSCSEQTYWLDGSIIIDGCCLFNLCLDQLRFHSWLRTENQIHLGCHI